MVINRIEEQSKELNVISQQVNLLTGFLGFYKAQGKDQELQNSIHDALNGLVKKVLKEVQNDVRENKGA